MCHENNSGVCYVVTFAHNVVKFDYFLHKSFDINKVTTIQKRLPRGYLCKCLLCLVLQQKGNQVTKVTTKHRHTPRAPARTRARIVYVCKYGYLGYL